MEVTLYFMDTQFFFLPTIIHGVSAEEDGDNCAYIAIVFLMLTLEIQFPRS